MIKYQFNEVKVSKEKYWENVKWDLDVDYDAFHSYCFSQGMLEFTPFIKGGYELTELLEKISGSIEFRNEYEEAQSKNNDTEKQTIELTKQIAELWKEKKGLELMDGYMEDCKEFIEGWDDA